MPPNETEKPKKSANVIEFKNCHRRANMDTKKFKNSVILSPTFQL